MYLEAYFLLNGPMCRSRPGLVYPACCYRCSGLRFVVFCVTYIFILKGPHLRLSRSHDLSLRSTRKLTSGQFDDHGNLLVNPNNDLYPCRRSQTSALIGHQVNESTLTTLVLTLCDSCEKRGFTSLTLSGIQS